MSGATSREPSPASSVERWVASNVFAILLWLCGAGCGFAAAFISSSTGARIALALIGVAALWFGWRVSAQGGMRRRVYQLLERRFRTVGVNPADLRRFLGEPCLQAQALFLLARWRRLDIWWIAMQRYWRADVLYYGHPDEPIEDALNFPVDEADGVARSHQASV